jgi:hypothetical protein
MAKDWAEECAERWADKAYEGVTEIDTAILHAIREALEKAAEVVHAEHLNEPQDGLDLVYDEAITDAENAIRALGAK